MQKIPLLIDFVGPSSLTREDNRVSQLPIVGNGPPGTFVVVANIKISLPTDQIVSTDDSQGFARVGFGGMQFVGMENERLMFVRIREMLPEDQLSPARSHTMRLNPEWVSKVWLLGALVWHSGAAASLLDC